MKSKVNRQIERAYLLNPPMTKGFVRGGRWQGVRARGRTMYYPIWLAYTAAALEDIGTETLLRDAPAEGIGPEEVVKEAENFGPDLVVVETNFSTLTRDLDIASRIKQVTSDSALLAIVGPPCMTHLETIEKVPEIDYIIKGEYDFAIQDLAMASRSKTVPQPHRFKIESVNGKEIVDAFESPSTRQDLDSESFVSSVYKRHLNLRNYFLDHTLWPEVQIISGRGCPYSCSFCSWPRNLTGRRPRFRSSIHVVEELRYIEQELTEVKEVFFEDDTFTLDKKRTIEICEGLKKEDFDLIWSCQARADLSLSLMMKMKGAGCRLLDVGFESGSDHTLKEIQKGVTRNELIEFARNARKAGLLVLGDFMVGLPGESEIAARETIRFAKQLDLDMVQFSVATPIPGTPFYDHCESQGYLTTSNLEESIDSRGFQRAIVSYPHLSSSAIEALVDEGIRKFYFRPTYLMKVPRMLFGGNPIGELKRIANGGFGLMSYLLRP